mmetsp:Transcript_8613/g.26535  ORF Transcript_8613/g.26535 Transcript_8613/m.26535 type:complete len:100 (+) Transcript_8613:370-669(+)
MPLDGLTTGAVSRPTGGTATDTMTGIGTTIGEDESALDHQNGGVIENMIDGVTMTTVDEGVRIAIDIEVQIYAQDADRVLQSRKALSSRNRGEDCNTFN